MGGAHMNETYSEAKFKDMLESLLTDDKIQELTRDVFTHIQSKK